MYGTRNGLKTPPSPLKGGVTFSPSGMSPPFKGGREGLFFHHTLQKVCSLQFAVHFLFVMVDNTPAYSSPWQRSSGTYPLRKDSPSYNPQNEALLFYKTKRYVLILKSATIIQYTIKGRFMSR